MKNTITFFAALIIFGGVATAQSFTNQIVGTGLESTTKNREIRELLDYNNDGYEDIIYQTNTSLLALYKNNGNNTFTDVTSTANIPAFQVIPSNILSADLDNNGFKDLIYYLHHYGSNAADILRVFMNYNGVFTEKTAEYGITNPITHGANHFCTDIHPIDYDKDGDLDILFASTQRTGSNTCNNSKVSIILNNTNSITNPKLNTIIDLVNYPANIYPAYHLGVTDYNNDQLADIVVCEQNGAQGEFGPYRADPFIIYKNNGDATFSKVEGTNLADAALNNFITVWDYNNDGFLDFINGTTDCCGTRTNIIWRNNGNGTYTDMRSTYDLHPVYVYYSRLSAIDFNNDGFFDISTTSIGYMDSRHQLWQNNGSSFTNNAAINNLQTGYAGYSNNMGEWFDYDNDGDLDYYCLIWRGGSTYYQYLMNNPNSLSNKYLRIKLVGTNSPKDGTGSRVVVKIGNQKLTQYNNGSIGNNYSDIFHFGLGQNATADSLLVYWSSGKITRIANVSANQTITITESSIPTIANIPAPALMCAGSVLHPDTPVVGANGAAITAQGWEMETAVDSGSFGNLTLPYTVAFADNGKKIRYYATNSCGAAYSNQVVIAVKKPTIIITQPKDSTIVYGCNAPIMSVAAIGEGELSYQWYMSAEETNIGGEEIVGATNSSYQTPLNYAVGSYYYYVVATGECGSQTSEVAVVTITPQIAPAVGNMYYTGPLMAYTANSMSNTATVALSASIKNGDPCGDIRTAIISFVFKNEDGSFTPISSAKNLLVGFIDPNNPALGGTAAAIAQLNISGNASSDVFEIWVIISGNYTGNPVYSGGSITIMKPSSTGGVIAGGVTLNNTNSAGYIKGIQNSMLNFNVEFAAKAKAAVNPKGKVKAYILSMNKPDGTRDSISHTYYIQSNAITSLNIVSTSSPKTATLTSKCNVSEVNLDGSLTNLDGGCQMTLELSDVQPFLLPNQVDLVGLTIQRSNGGIWYSNNWVNTKTEKTTIHSGNISISQGASSLAKVAEFNVEEGSVTETSFIAYPNPFTTQLNFSLQTPADTHARLEIFDLTGRQVAVAFDGNINANELYTFDFKPASSISSGLLSYRLILNEKVINGKVMLKGK